ncbi:MAG: ABC transporter ATP-binding protein [Phyllobacteriaceae bacterium]|nr:ABC transporter ATP-binding protein [Phyllobacteriaceae bacterium]
MTALISFEDLTLGYDRHPAVHHLDGAIETGALTAIVGPNGAGKSTLLKAIAGVLEPIGGTLRFHGCDRRDVAHLPQIAEIDRSFPLSVYDFVAMGAWRRVGAFSGIGRGEGRRIGAALAAVGLEGFERRPIGTLSGGQMQRAMFARLVLQDATVILLDEPFNAVDARTEADLLALVHRWHDEGRTVIAVSHDLDMVRAQFPDCLMLARECVGAGPTSEVLTEAGLARAHSMIGAFDTHAHVCARAS